MRTSSKRLGNGLAEMTVEIEPAEFQSEYARAVKRISGKARIPGFRPGKAPRGIVESMFGRQAIIGEALEHLVPNAYDRAIREESLEPIDRPEVDLAEVEGIDEPVVFKATVPLRPTAELGDVETISLTKDRVTVEDGEMEEVLNDIRRSRAELKPVENRQLQEGDLGEARLSIIAGEIEKADEKPVSFMVGQNWLPRGFDSNVMGMEIGDVRVFDLDIPDDYYDEDLRGKYATFTAELLSVRAPELPELTDEFAESVSEFKSVEELRDDVRKRVLERKEGAADIELRRAALETLVARSRFEIPDVLIERHAEEVLKGRESYLTSQGVAVDTYLGSVGKTREQWQEEAETEAREDVKRTVTLVEYANDQDIEVMEPEVAAEIDSIVAAYPEGERDRIREAYRSDDMKNRLAGRLRDRKALDALIGAIEVTEAEPEQKTESEPETRTQLERTESGIILPSGSKAPMSAADSD